MPERRTKFPLIARLVLTQLCVSFAVGGLAIVLLYYTAIKDKERDLTDYAVGIASFIDTYAQFAPEGSVATTTYAITELAKQAFSEMQGIGESGAIFIIGADGEDLQILVSAENEDKAFSGIETLLYGESGLKISSAFLGRSGATFAIDGHGHEVMLSYAPIPSLELALVAAIHVDEVNHPFIRTIIFVVVIGFALVATGVVATYGPTTRMIADARESERRFKEFADNASDWYWEMDKDLRFTSVGRGERPGDEFEYSKYVGMTRPEVTVDDTSTEKWREHQADLDHRRPFKNFQYDLSVDGQRRTMSVAGFPYFEPDGKFMGYRGTGRDITDIIRNRRRFELAEAQLRTAFESITVGVVQIDAIGTIEIVNPMVSRIFGYEVSELIGQNVSMLMPEPDRSQHDQYLQKYSSGGPAKIIGYGREVNGLRKDGEVFPLHLGVAKMAIMDEVHYVGSLTDLTAEKELESQLRRSQKMDAVGQLTGGIAHDFNNLLGIIVGNLDLAQRRIDGDEKLGKYIGKSMTAANRGSELTRRLLNFSRQNPEENEIVDINETIREIRELIQRSITADISVDLLLAEDVWPVKINKGDFEDAIVNFAVNARDAMPNGGILLIETRNTEIESSVPETEPLPSGDYVELIISDTGCGMSDDVVSRIFEPFFTTKAQGKGTGLGMALVYGFVQRCAGSISVYSEEGVGTTFKIRLPRAFESGAEAAPGRPPRDEKIIPRGNETVLIVDDEPDLTDVAETVLRDLGYRTVVAHNGQEANLLLKSDRRFDLLFSDVVMPGGINGYELAEKALSLRPDIKILLASGFTADAVRNSLPGAEARFPLLSKPYGNLELAREIRRILDEPVSVA